MIALDLITVFWVNRHQKSHKTKPEVSLDLLLEIRGFGPQSLRKCSAYWETASMCILLHRPA